MIAQSAYFITGTDTGIGKTLVSSALLHALTQRGLRAAAMKPVAAGAAWRDGAWHNDDIDCLSAAANVALPQAWTTPYLFREAIAPHIAAAQEQTLIDLVHIRDCYARIAAMADAMVVEGVGGFRVPLSAHADTADLARQLGLPVILVVGMRLGCLNQALLTAEAIAARGLILAGWVANHIDAAMSYSDANVAALSARLPGPLLGRVPFMASPLPVDVAGCLDFSCLPGWPKVKVA